MLFLIEGDLFGLSLPINESETCNCDLWKVTFAKGTSLVLAHSTPLSAEVFAECSKTSKCRMNMKVRDWCLPFIGN